MFTGKHSWEPFGSLVNYYALTDKNKNRIGRILIDSVLRAYRDELITTFSDRGQLEHYGIRTWLPESSVGIGKAATKAIYLLAYVLGPLHRNASRQGSSGVNEAMLKRETG